MIHLIAIGQYLQGHVLGVLAAIVAYIVLGFLWHGPIFGMQWIKLNKMPMPKKEDMKFSMMIPGLCSSIATAFVQSAVMGRTFQILVMPNIFFAFLIATILWLPFTGMVMLTNYTWSQKPAKLFLLDGAFSLISLWLIAAILYVTL